MSAGKGSRPRNNHSQAFRDGWDRIFGPKIQTPFYPKKRPMKLETATQIPTGPSNGLKTQQNGPVGPQK